MQEHVWESCDGNIPKVVFGELASVGSCVAGRRLPAAIPGGVPTAGRASDAPRAPVGRTRVAPSVNPPDHNKCHTARPPSMGRIGTIRTSRSSEAVLPLSRQTIGLHRTIDPQLPSSVTTYPPPVVRPAIRFERQDFAMNCGPRQHHRVATMLFSSCVMAKQMDGRTRVPGANAPAHDTPPHTPHTSRPLAALLPCAIRALADVSQRTTTPRQETPHRSCHTYRPGRIDPGASTHAA